MKILVGSCATHFWIDSFRMGKDIDWWSLEQVEDSDCSIMPIEILEAMEDGSKMGGVATLNDLLTIKLSHMPYDIFWRKHVNDYLVIKQGGATINQELYVKLQEYWKEKHNNKPHLNLYRTKDAFFDDFVEKQHDHDRLHELVAFPNKPMYTTCLRDGQEVMIDRNKFLSLPFVSQVKMFREEVNVIAFERWVIPSKGRISYLQAYHKAVHKTVTALTKGWACTFMCENIEEFLRPNKKEVEHLVSVLNFN